MRSVLKSDYKWIILEKMKFWNQTLIHWDPGKQSSGILFRVCFGYFVISFQDLCIRKKPTKKHISLLLFFLLLESSHYIRKCSKGKHYQRLVMKIMENLSTREKIRFWFVRWELLPLGNINCKFYNFRKKINWGQVGNYFLKNNMLAFFQVPTSRKKRKIMHYTMDLIKRSNNCPTCLTWNSSYKPVLIF